MFRYYILIAFRNLFKSRKGKSVLFTIINLTGLTIGLASFLLIGHFVNYEWSYDLFIPNQENIYRLAVERHEGDQVTMQSAKTYAGIGPLLSEEVPEVEQWVRVLDEECMLHYKEDNITFNRQRTFWADGSFPEIFDLDFVQKGNLPALYEPNQAIISKSAAERFFGNEWSGDRNPIGKTIMLNEWIPFMIQGVYEDLPANSHMEVDFVVSYETLTHLVGEQMKTVMPPGGNFVYKYISVKDGVDPKLVEPLVNDVIRRHTTDSDSTVSFHFEMQPVSGIHLESHLSDELNPNGNKLFVMALGVAGLLILIVAWINFINLTTVRALNRSKEVGVRKTFGAGKQQLSLQFVTETLVASVIASIAAVAIVYVSSGYFESLTEIATPIFSIVNMQIWVIFVGIFLLGGLIASVYPALVLSSFNPIKALKNKYMEVQGVGYLRRGLMVFQFFAAIFLISATAAIYYQIHFMRSQELGMKPEQVLVLHTPRSMIGNENRAEAFERYRDILEQNSAIESVASGGCLPGKDFLYHTENVHPEGKEITFNWSFDLASVDEGYLPTLGMELLAGRNFEKRADEDNKVILNQTGVLALGFTDEFDALGKMIRINQDEKKQIVGVVADAHYEGLQKQIKPLLLHYGHDYEFGFFPIKIQSSELNEVIATIESLWNENYPKDPMDYFFLDEFFDRQYKNDQAYGNIFGSFSILALVIAGLGLFGLVAYSAQQKSKEIGIRKVLGASVFSIVKLLTSGMLKLMLVAALIAIPIVGFLLHQWLDTFAYRFEPSWWMYVLPLLAIVMVSAIAVGGQTLKAALSNPIDSIAEE